MTHSESAPTNGVEVTGQSDLRTDITHPAPRVLVVDDDPAIQLLMRETLSEAGFHVSVTASGPEAIKACPEFMPDLVLLDINMPSMDGITACTEIRKQDKRNFPIVMVTSVDDAVSIQRAFDAGATDFILKPVNWPLFQRRLDSVLSEWNSAQELDESNDRVRLLERVAPEQVMLVSRSGRIIEDLKNRQEKERTDPEPAYQTLEEIFGAEVAQRFKQRISGVLKTRRHNNLEFAISKQGKSRDFEAQFLIDGRDRVIVVVQNVSVEKESKNEIYDLAFHDSISDLPNRHLYERCVEEALTDAGLHERSLTFISLCFENISDKELADRDTMLAVANRFSECLSDCGCAMKIGKNDNAAVVSRVDFDRFMVTLDNVQTADEVSAACNQIADGFSDRIGADSALITISPRMGVASWPADGPDLKTVMHAAQSAMHEARQTGELVCLNSEAVTVRNVDALDYGNELRQAMDDGQLELYFQPRVSMPGGTITCVEALLRWNHPMRGFVGLIELLHLAKSTGLIVPLGDWVLRTACEQAQRWQCVPAPRVSINLSQQEFSRQDLADRVIENLERTGLDPARIDLELTEATLLRSEDELAELERLKGLGVGLVLDDFGTGLSSLAYLKRYPMDALKIDGSFVCCLPDNEEDAAICEVIITMAHKLGMKAVAEGVEKQEQLDFLLERGCDEFQGFHICRPLPADEIENYLNHPGQTHQ